MKIRVGFVSNSSSSSFAIYGAMIDVKEIFKAFVKNKILTQKEINNCKKEQSECELLRYGDYIKKLLGDDFSIEGDFEDISILSVGRKLESIKDSETGKEFKENTKKTLEKIFGNKIICDYDIDISHT
jgi:hypothetical protein